jgi:TRAP-type mannitol/chloroaromatic compound transport system permease small subunit
MISWLNSVADVQAGGVPDATDNPETGGGWTIVISTICWINEQIGRIISLLIFPIVLIVAFEVIARYFFNRSTIWAHEMSTMLFGAYMILGGGYALRHRAHVRTDILVARFSPRVQAGLSAALSVLLFVFAGAMLWSGATLALSSIRSLEHSSTVWGPPIYPLKAAIPVGAALLLLQGIANLLQDLAIAIRGRQ